MYSDRRGYRFLCMPRDSSDQGHSPYLCLQIVADKYSDAYRALRLQILKFTH